MNTDLTTIDASILTDNPELAALIEESAQHDIAAFGARINRFPKVKVGHSNQTFSLPDDSVTKELKGWVVTHASFMEYYEKREDQGEDENKAPVCVAINHGRPSKFESCETCPHHEWKDKRVGEGKYRECSSSHRLLIKIPKIDRPVELKIPQTSVGAFNKKIQELKSASKSPLCLFDFSIRLSSKKDGNSEWSMFEFTFTPLTAESKVELAKEAQNRLREQKDLLKYFENIYGAMNAANSIKNSGTSGKHQTAPVEKTLFNKVTGRVKPEASVSDAEIVDNPDLDDLAF